MTDPPPAVNTAKVRADWAETLTPWTYPGEANAGKTWGPYGDDIAGWAMDNVPVLLDALDAARSKLAAVREVCQEAADGGDCGWVFRDVLAILDGEAPSA